MEGCYKDLTEKFLNVLLNLGVDFADLRVVELRGLRIEVADGRLKELRFINEKGLAVRCLVAGKWGFTSTSILTSAEVERACIRAYKLARSAGGEAEARFQPSCKPAKLSSKVVPIIDPSSIDVEEKLKLCSEMEKVMRGISSIKSTSSTYFELEESTYVVNSLGLEAECSIPSLIVSATAYASEAGIVQRGHDSHGGTGGFEIFKARDPKSVAQEASRDAIELLSAKGPPAGKHTCILDPEIAGVFIHEAFGHACEADIVLHGGSILEGMLGRKVGSEEVTVRDDPTVKGLYGYLPIDCEGINGSGTTIVDRGILKSYLHNLETSARMGTTSTGNARAQGYSSIPIVRMTNTFIERGDWKVDELLQDLKKGVYAKGSHYGYVDTAKGEFVFKCAKLYVVENGEQKQLCRDAALSGHILDVLMNVEAVANDLSFKPGLCGKDGQLVRVTSGAPHIRVKDVIIGGLM
ncbi:MAG: TldD/PmbA family protein [Candidatus Nezhaarchaeota archaeon]|nr:TldD/PmbA family protein [Candidatus Nezhaarchaeota archaeon]